MLLFCSFLCLLRNSKSLPTPGTELRRTSSSEASSSLRSQRPCWQVAPGLDEAESRCLSVHTLHAASPRALRSSQRGIIERGSPNLLEVFFARHNFEFKKREGDQVVVLSMVKRSAAAETAATPARDTISATSSEFAFLLFFAPQILASEVSLGYDQAPCEVVSVNGERVRNLRDLVKKVETSSGDFITLRVNTVGHTKAPLVIDRKKALAIHRELLKRHLIPADRSPNLEIEDAD